MNLCNLFLERARAQPRTIAIVERGDTITYEELARRSGQVAALSRQRGIGRGARVLILIPMSIELYSTILGVLQEGAVAVLLDPGAGIAQVDRCCELAQPDVMVGVARAHLLRATSSAVRSIPRKFVTGAAWLRGAGWCADAYEPLDLAADVGADAPALLTFTSGSTGNPKAAVRSHGLLHAQQQALEEALELRPGEADLTTLPAFVLSNLAAGVTSVIADADLRHPGTIAPAPVLAQIARYRPASFVGSPAFLNQLILSGEPLGFRRIYTGGAPVFWHMMDAAARAAPGARITALYGSTEAEPLCEIAPNELTEADRKVTLRGGGLPAGRPVRQALVRVLPDRWGTALGGFDEESFADACLGADEIGEVVVSGPHVLRGYLDGLGDSETKFKVGATAWHRTGDSGYIDSRGRVWLTGRCSAKIVNRDGTVYPLQVEAAAHVACSMRRTALVGGDFGRVLFVETSRKLSVQERNQLEGALAWAGLSKIVEVASIPVDRRHNAKIDYPALLRQLRESGAIAESQAGGTEGAV